MSIFRQRYNRHRGLAGAVLMTTFVLGACDLDDVLTVPDEEVATPGALQGPAGLATVLAGAKSDFQVAYSGGVNEGHVNMIGLFTDELHYASTFPTRIEVDQRDIKTVNSTMEPIHRYAHRARALALQSAESHAEFGPNTLGHAESLNLYGYTIILLGENYCSGVPLSRLSTTGAVEYGEPQTTQQLFEEAVRAFDNAITVATAAGSSASAQLNLARVGKARALLGLGRHADAAAAVAAVPTSFVYYVHHSENSDRQNNAAYVYQYTGRRWAVANRQGTNGLPFREDQDPRVPWVRGTGSLANAFDDSPLYLQLKYPDRSAPTMLASGVEARLVEAEAALRANNASWLTSLNALRSSPPAYYPATTYAGINSMAPLTDPGNDAARVNMLFKERAYWLYLTGHRLSDMRRLIRQYNRAPDTVFPVGEFGTWTPDKGGNYGTDVNWPIPFDEENNPNFSGCLNRGA